MLIRRATLDEIVGGRVSLQFRRWKRPTVKDGGTLLTSVGQLAIDDVRAVTDDELTEKDAARAGFADLAALRDALGPVRDGTRLYRIAVRYQGADPRVALRSSVPDDDEAAAMVATLRAWDARSRSGPWTRTALRLIADHPETLAAELATAAGLDRARFKSNVRRLKGLGLTESLERGYRLSPRGSAVLSAMESEQG